MRLTVLLWLTLLLAACGGRTPESSSAERRAGDMTVTAYVSEDQVFSEPIIGDFERDTGIRVRAVYDTEEAKSTGVMNRLIAEKGNPQADVYWANEPIRAEVLKQQGISAPYRSPNAEGIPAHFKDPDGHWTGFSARARAFIVHNSLGDAKPGSFRDYASPMYRGKGVIANPLFGTTTAYVAALFTQLGDEKGRELMEALKKNNVKMSSSNGESADLVASGEFKFSLVDTDDAFSRMKQGRPISIVYPDQSVAGIGCMVIPNAVILIKGGPNAAAGKRLMDYLLSRDTERKLAFSDAAQIPLHSGVETPQQVPRIESLRTMQLNYAAVARKMQEIQPYLKDWARQ